jgi:hypothetical protein
MGRLAIRRRDQINLLKWRLLVWAGVRHWGTKSFEFWTLLSALLAAVRPKSIIELGSGRSTSYLTEYAMKADVPYISIEQNRWYVRKVRRGLRNSFLTDRYLHHVPLASDGWYEGEKLRRLADFPCELLFLDGPVGGLTAVEQGVRRCERSVQWLRAVVATCHAVIVDDVHYRSVFQLFHELLPSANNLSTFYLSYHVQPVPNVLAVAITPSAYETLTRVCADLNIRIFTDYSLAQCTEP